jgi:y4mF family transcriptional regulator
MKNEIGKNIKEIRKKYNLTQVELSDRAEVGLRFLRELEQGKPTVRLDKITQVLQLFGYHIEIVKNERKL